MRVLVDARGLLEEVKAGVEGYTLQMLMNLKRMYPEDEYILFSYSWQREPDAEIRKEFEWIHKKWPNKLASLSWRFLNWPKVDDLVENVDVVWYPNIRFMPVRKCKKIVTVHDVSFEIVSECYRTQSKWWHWYMNIKENLKKADKIVTVSKNTAEDVEKVYGIDKSKITSSHLGIGEIGFGENIKDLRKKYNIGKKYIVHVGTLEKRKNIGKILTGYLTWIDWKIQNGFDRKDLPEFVLIGGKGWSMNKDLVDIVENNEWVHYLGYVDEGDKNTIVSNAVFLVYLSYYEGFGFPPLEAMKMGVPVLSSFGGSLGEVVDDNCFVVDCLHEDSIVNGLEKLSSDEELRQYYVNKSRKYVERFDWEDTARKFHTELEKLI